MALPNWLVGLIIGWIVLYVHTVFRIYMLKKRQSELRKYVNTLRNEDCGGL